MEDNLIRTYIKRNLADLLAKTAKMYPDIFTPEIIAEEMSLLTGKVTSMDITYNRLTGQPAVQPGTTVDNGSITQGRGGATEPMTMDVLPSPPLIDLTPIFNPVSSNPPVSTVLLVPAKPRCIARVMDKENPITVDTGVNGTVDSQGNKIYGKRCSRPENDPSTHKCTMHAKHSPHGDFTTEPSDVLKQHFQHVQSKVAKKAI